MTQPAPKLVLVGRDARVRTRTFEASSSAMTAHILELRRQGRHAEADEATRVKESWARVAFAARSDQ